MKDNFFIKVILSIAFSICIIFLATPILALFLSPWIKAISIFKDEFVISAFLTSIKSTFISLIIITIFGMPTAYVMARVEFKFKQVVGLIIEMPLVLPPAVAGLLLLIAFGKYGIVGKYLYKIGVQLPFSFMAVIIAQVFVSMPIFIKTVKSGIEKVDRDLEVTALTLGDTPFKVFKRITLPLCKNSIITGAVLSWSRSLAEFGATIMFAGNLLGKTQTLPLAIYTAMEQDINLALSIAVMLVFISILVLIILKKIANES